MHFHSMINRTTPLQNNPYPWGHWIYHLIDPTLCIITICVLSLFLLESGVEKYKNVGMGYCRATVPALQEKRVTMHGANFSARCLDLIHLHIFTMSAPNKRGITYYEVNLKTIIMTSNCLNIFYLKLWASR